MRSLVAIALGLVLAVSGGSALAAPAAHGKRPVPAQGRHEGKDAAKFPMPAAAFKQKVDARLAKARQHMEARAAKLSADRAIIGESTNIGAASRYSSYAASVCC